ncbi:MAG TPA: hypothetical protein VF544_04025 [Pyrinomonadaceae bacterium]|jgi:hypothetical protein
MVETCDIDEMIDGMQEDLREFTRHDASLSFSIPLIADEAQGMATGEQPQLVSHTRDVCAGGMALLIPSLPFMYRYLLGPDYTLRFTLHLPDGPIRIEAAPIYDRPLKDEDMNLGFAINGRIEIEATPRQYERYEQEGASLGCLIGVRIKQMSERDRTRYQEYLDILEIERSIKILTDETDEVSEDELKQSASVAVAEPVRFATPTSRALYHTAPYEYH